MPAYDSPDYERIVTIVTSGLVSDAPDWQRVVTGPSGGSVPGTGGVSDFIATDFGWAGWTAQFMTNNISLPNEVPTTGLLYLVLLKCVKTTTISHVGCWQTSAGTRNYIANENYVGLYTGPPSSSGAGTVTRLGVSAAGAVEAALPTGGANGPIPIALTSSVSVTAGTLYYAAWVTNTTAFSGGIAITTGVSSAISAFYTPSGAVTFYTDGTTTNTSLPGTYTLQSQSHLRGTFAPWMYIA